MLKEQARVLPPTIELSSAENIQEKLSEEKVLHTAANPAVTRNY